MCIGLKPRLHIVLLSHTDATGGDDNIYTLYSRRQDTRDVFSGVLHNAKVDHVDAELLQGGNQHRPIAVLDLSILERLASGHELVTGRRHRHLNASVHLNALHSERRQESDLSCCKNASGRQHELADSNVTTDVTNPLPGLYCVQNANRRLVLLGVDAFDLRPFDLRSSITRKRLVETSADKP